MDKDAARAVLDAVVEEDQAREALKNAAYYDGSEGQENLLEQNAERFARARAAVNAACAADPAVSPAARPPGRRRSDLTKA